MRQRCSGVCVTPWGLAAAGVAAAGSIGSGLIGADASKNAAKTQADAANNATGFQKQMYGDTVAREQPFLQGGTNALADLQRLLGIGQSGGPTSPILQMLGIGQGGTGSIDPRTFQGSPGYQYTLQQGTNAVTNSAHGNIGGNALRALQQTGQGLANQNWNQYLGQAGNAWGNLLSGVSGVANQGQNAATNLGGFGQNLGAQVGSNIIGGGNATAAGQVGGANALSGGINALLKALMTGGLGSGSTSAPIDLFSGNGLLSANSLNSTFGTQFGAGTFPTAANPGAVPPGYAADTYTPL